MVQESLDVWRGEARVMMAVAWSTVVGIQEYKYLLVVVFAAAVVVVAAVAVAVVVAVAIAGDLGRGHDHSPHTGQTVPGVEILGAE